VATGDSLVMAGMELLMGGVASDHPMCPGAVFRLAKGWDFAVPATSYSDAVTLIMAGEVPTGARVPNRTVKLPVIITVPRSADPAADRAILAGAAEHLVTQIAAERWDMTWTRMGGLPFTLVCFAAHAAAVDWDLIRDAQLQRNMAVEFTALPFGRGDTPEVVTFKSTAAAWTPPPDPVHIDAYSSGQMLSADNSGFEATAGTWVNVTNCAVARSTTRHRTGAASLGVTSSAAGSMTAALCSLANVPTQGVPVTPGQLVTVSGYHRTQVAGTERTAYIEAEFATSGGASLGAVASPGVTEVAANGNWTAQQTVTGTAPATAAGFRVRARWATPAAGAEAHYLDDVYADTSAVASAVDAASWSPSFQRVSGNYSARWSARPHACAVYDKTLPAPLDLTGLTKLTLWLGLGSSSSHHWQGGRKATVKIDLYDGNGNHVTTTITATCRASGLPSSPHWQRVSGYIPQVTAVDMTTISRYVVSVYNHTESAGQRVLQGDCYLNALDATGPSTGTPGPRGAVYPVPGGVGTAPSPVAVQVQPGPSVGPTTTTFTTPGDNPWVATGVSLVQLFEMWAAGGGGEGGHGNEYGGGGGGGGGYAARRNITVTPGSTYHIYVGAAGSAGAANGDGGTGGDTYGDATLGGRAHGGQGGGLRGSGLGGLGGSGSTDDIHHPGGDGGDTEGIEHGQGGGGSGGPAADGRDAPDRAEDGNGAPAVTGGGPGGQGGHVAPGAGMARTGYTPASGPGGGGGGGAHGSDGSNYAGGAGFRGQARLTYLGTAGSPLKTCVLVHLPSDEPSTSAPLIPLGALNTSYTAPATGQVPARYEGTYRALLGMTWNTPANSRDITAIIYQRQSGLPDRTITLTRAGVVPNTDKDPAGGPVSNGLLDMGVVTLPLAPIAAGNITDYHQVHVDSTNASDVPLDLLLIPSTAQCLIYSTAGSGVANLWLDTPALGADLGHVLGSQADRDQAVSLLGECDYSGGPLWIGDGDHRVVIYSVQGVPALMLTYVPWWRLDRLA
jgi:hypothetical protein